ncbi:MAG: PepSY domain-containing protein [Gammaproteobacteria bacterium]
MKRGLLVLGLSCIALTAPFPASSWPFYGLEDLAPQVISGQPKHRPQISLNEAVRRIQHETDGRVLAADAVGGDGQLTYRIKVLMPSGHVRVFYVDAGG